jgi:hypothetical protein
MVTLAVFYFHFYNVLEDLRMMTDNPDACQFIDLLERRFFETADGTLAEFAHVFTPDGFRWVASRRERVNSFDALDEVNSPIRQGIVMELKQPRLKTVTVADYCGRRDIHPQLPLVYDCYLETSGPAQLPLPSFWLTDLSVHWLPGTGTDQLACWQSASTQSRNCLQALIVFETFFWVVCGPPPQVWMNSHESRHDRNLALKIATIPRKEVLSGALCAANLTAIVGKSMSGSGSESWAGLCLLTSASDGKPPNALIDSHSSQLIHHIS